MSIFQLLAAVFAFFMMYVVRIKSRKHKLRASEVYGWYLIWILFVILALFPNLLLGVAHVLHFGRVFDLLVVGAFMIITSLTMYLYFLVRDLQQKVEYIVRAKTLEKKSDARQK